MGLIVGNSGMGPRLLKLVWSMFSDGPHEEGPAEQSRIMQRMGTMFSESLSWCRESLGLGEMPSMRIIWKRWQWWLCWDILECHQRPHRL